MGEKFAVEAPDGVVLRAQWLAPSPTPGEAIKTRRMRDLLSDSDRLPWGEVRGTVVMLHGRSGRKEDAFPVAERFVAAGFGCLIYDARAHGESGGPFSTFGFRERADLSAVIDEAERRIGSGKLGPLVGFGISQGAAVLLQALPEEPRLQSAVVVSPFAALDPIIRRAAERRFGVPIASVAAGGIMTLGGWRGGFVPADVKPMDAASRIEVPVMVVHGENDGVIPWSHGREVYEALPTGSGIWRPVPDGYHGNVLAVGGDELYREMILFWIENLGKPDEKRGDRDAVAG